MSLSVYQCKTPVLIIAFNRPDYLAHTFEQVRKVQPAILYLAVDGARENRDKEIDKVMECRDFAQRVDWPCEVHTLFRGKNVGCGYGPAGAIDWAFQTTERLIILEDDCVADISFFRFCDELLERYSDDQRVWCISGRGHHPEYPFFNDHDYIFSHYGHTWGWATWRRCWNHFDIMMSDFPKWQSYGGAKNTLSNNDERKDYYKWFQTIYDQIQVEVTHSWDAQWEYTRMKEGALNICPAVNLIHNIGIEGTHSNEPSAFHDLPSASIHFPLRHPEFIMPLANYEEYHYRKHIRSIRPCSPLHVIKELFKKIIRR